jgi:hypothetical protein
MSGEAVLFIDDICRELRVGRRTVEKLRRHGSFPIPELPSIDKRPRWSRQAVDAFLQTAEHGASIRRIRRVR